MQSSAFADGATRDLVTRARRARSSQNSSLRGYDAKTQARFTVSMRTSALTPNKLLFRTENISQVRWRRSQGMWIEPLGSRHTLTVRSKAMVSGVVTSLIAVPYFPGRDQLWLPGGDLDVVKFDVDASEGFVHPLAEGSEAYYRFRIADSARIRLPNGEQLTLRELTVTARRPDWRSFVGSFWFDQGSGSLVRAAYRLSAPIDIWDQAVADARRDMLDAARDTTVGRAKRMADAREAMPPAVVRSMINPMRFDVNLVTVEYALHEGRFWLPYVHRAEGHTQIAFMRMPFTIEESYKMPSSGGLFVDSVSSKAARFYERNRDLIRSLTRPRNLSYAWAGAGLLQTPADLVRMTRPYFDGTFTSATLSTAFTEQLLTDGTPTGVAFIWRVENDWRGRPVAHHAGVNPGARSVVLMRRYEGRSVAVMTNIEWTASMDRTANMFAEALFNSAPGRRPMRVTGTWIGTLDSADVQGAWAIIGETGWVSTPAKLRARFSSAG